MIFFDIDGTLINHKQAERKAANQFAITQSLPGYDDGTFVERWHKVSEYFMDQYLQGNISFEMQRHLRLEKILEQKLSALEAKALFQLYLKAYEKNWTLYDDVLICLDRLDSPIGIITNGNTNQQLKKLSSTSIIERFSIIVTSEDTGKSKPDPEIFCQAKSRIKKTEFQCIYIGDSLENDALAANAAGWRGIWLNRNGKQSSQIHDVEMINTLVDFSL